MKKSLILSIIVLFAISTGIIAQTKAKFGHIDSNELMKVMPGRDSAQTKLETYTKDLEKTLKTMQTELETKYNDYQSGSATMTDFMKQTKAKELQDLNTRIEAFQTAAQQELETKEAELLKPIIDKAKKAISEVAKENGYTYVLDSGVGVLLYSDPSDDIMPLVKKKLGIVK